MQQNLTGQIERVTYTNEENGYTIAKIKVHGHHDLVTVVGNILSPSPGAIIEMKGVWTSHAKYGEQFKVISHIIKTPASEYGIQKYLGSGLIKGIGPKMAKRIVKEFGKNTLEIIEKNIYELDKIQGIGKKRIKMITLAWEEQKNIREVMVFLQSHGVSSGYATKIFKQYGNSSISVVQKNPYRLATDIFGIGFITADKIAEKLGFAKDSKQRAEAGILYVLHQLSDEGHVYYPYGPLLTKCTEMLKVEKDIIINAIGQIALENKIVIEDLNQNIDNFKENNKAVYLEKFFFCEIKIAKNLKKILNAPKSIRYIESKKAVEWIQEHLAIQLAKQQKEAVISVIENKITIVNGKPGTGKTTIIQAFIKIFSSINAKITLAAPTGRASKRMSEATGKEAKTIHRLLEFSMQKGKFKYNEKNPIDCDLLVIDEASMIDTILMHHLLKAIPLTATLVIVGDVDQLPSVGAGNVLKDIISSQKFAVVELNEIFRQAQTSQIIVNAHKINKGIIPSFQPSNPNSDFYFIEQNDPEQVLQIILELTSKRIPNRFGLNPIDDIQILAPMHKGTIGVSNLNIELQAKLNSNTVEIVRGYKKFKLFDKVIQLKNNYNKEVYNGDIGKVTKIDKENQEITICFDNKDVVYEFTDLDEVVLAYAVSVHKSQGSEFNAVIIPIMTQHYILLQRNLIYTAITRGKKLVVLVGQKKAMAMAVKNDKVDRRFTRLSYRL